jgi:hypothetical protein
MLVGLGLSIALVGCESEADRAEALLAELAQELPLRAESSGRRRARIHENLAPALATEFQLEAPGIGAGNDRDYALTAATELERIFPLRALDLSGTQVQLSASGRRAFARGTARVSGAQPGDLHGYDVAFDVDLEKQGSVWRVARLVLSDPERPLPESRP